MHSMHRGGSPQIRPNLRLLREKLPMRTRLSLWEIGFGITNLILTTILLYITFNIGRTANRLLSTTSESSNRVLVSQRAASVRPRLKVVTKRVEIGNKEAQALMVTISNIGTGTAQGIIVFVRDNLGFMEEGIQNLYEIGTLPILKFPPVQNIPVNPRTKRVLDQFYRKPVVPESSQEEISLDRMRVLNSSMDVSNMVKCLRLSAWNFLFRISILTTMNISRLQAKSPDSIN